MLTIPGREVLWKETGKRRWYLQDIFVMSLDPKTRENSSVLGLVPSGCLYNRFSDVKGPRLEDPDHLQAFTIYLSVTGLVLRRRDAKSGDMERNNTGWSHS
jgi:hypothetical protein